MRTIRQKPKRSGSINILLQILLLGLFAPAGARAATGNLQLSVQNVDGSVITGAIIDRYDSHLSTSYLATDSWAWTQIHQSSGPTPNPAHEFFDDFTYTTVDDANLRNFGWYVRTAPGGPGVSGASWRKQRVTFLVDPNDSSNRVMRLSAITAGTPATTSHSEVGTGERFFEGTYAARVRLRDAPITGSPGDGIVEAPLFTINGLRYDYDPAYSECDFEYLPKDVWSGQPTPQMFFSTYETYREDPWDAIKLTDQIAGSLDGWHTLLLQVFGGYVSYSIDGVLKAPPHGGIYYPDSPMAILFQMWFVENGLNSGNSVQREYAIDIDWVYHGKDSLLSDAQVGELVARFKSAAVARRDTMSGRVYPDPPLLANATVAGTTFTVSVPSQVGYSYILEYKNSLNDARWTAIQTNNGTGGQIVLTNTGIPAPSRFYRVRVR